jgi:hypothetical protein
MRKVTNKMLPAAVFGALMGLLCSGTLFAQSTVLPEGHGKDIAQNACTICHNASIITQQRLSLAAWTKEVDKMVRWNAPVEPSDHDVLVRYLFENFPPRPDPPPTYDLPAGSGHDTVHDACLSCHDSWPIISARQSGGQWEETVRKMERWGAKLTPRERTIILRYVTKNFPDSAPPATSSLIGR